MIFLIPMNRPLKYAPVWFALFLCQVVQAMESDLPLVQDQINQLSAGEVVFLEPDGNDMLKAVIRINAPLDLIWQVMLDHQRVPKYVDELRESHLLEQGDNWKIIEHTLKMHTLLPTFHYVFREEYGSDHSITFNRLRGAFKSMTGSWRLFVQEDGEYAYLVYSTFVEFGWLIPNSWVERGINKSVPNLLKAFREEVYSDKKKQASEDGSQ
jgi:hypothetical protein